MKGFRFLIVVIFIGILVFPGCKKFKVPAGFPDPDEMAEIIAELHLVESTMNFGSNFAHSNERNNPGYYRGVLEKFGLTSVQFDTIRKWYVENPVIYQYVYDRAIVILSKREAEARIAMESENEHELNKQAELRKRRSNIWQGETRFVIGASDTIDKRLPYRIATDSLEINGTLRLMAFFKFLKEDVSRSPRMMLSVFYADSTADTVYQEITYSFHKKGTVLDVNLKNDVKAMEVYGFLLLQDSVFSASVEVEDVSLIVVKDSLRKDPLNNSRELEKAVQ